MLHPGESLRSPRILQLRWENGDADRACNLFRRTMFAHILPRINGQLVWPPIAHLSTAFYELNASNEQNVLSHLESLRGLGFEMFWLDAYWTGPSGFPNSMGNYMTGYLNAAIKAYKLSCLRIDYNIDPLAFWRFMDTQAPNRVGLTEMRYVEGLYRMWDDVLQANPGLFIDNCASGGRRIDLETMSRSLPLWRSDNTCDMLDLKPATVLAAARKNQLMSVGLNRYVPFSTVGQMGAAPYLFRSGFNAGIAFAEDVRPKGYPRDLDRKSVV